MKSHLVRLSLIAALACATTAALAENPFVGTWKADYSKSHLTGQTVSFTKEPGGTVRIASANDAYSFKPDGSDTKDSFGDTVQWKQMDDHTWKEFVKEGSMVVTDTWTLAADGKTLEVAASGTRPDGKDIDSSDTYTRLGVGKGFFGKWKSTKVDDKTPVSREFEANGDDGVIWKLPELKASVALKFDGKAVAPTGPTVPEGLTIAGTKLGPRSIELTEKLKGKVVYKGHLTVSPDGKTMTQVGGAPTGVQTTLVFQKA
jgi:plastocyanin